MKLSSLIKLCTGFTTIFATKNMDLNDQNADISEMEELFAVGIVNLAATEVEKLTTEKEKELPPNEKFEKAADVKEKLDTNTMEESVTNTMKESVTNTMEESDIDEKILSINKKALAADKKAKLDPNTIKESATNTIKESIINENERKKSAIDKKKKSVVNEEKKAAYSKEKNPDSDKKKVLEASNPFSEGDTNSPQQKEKEKIPLFPEDEYKNFNCLLEKIDTLI
ncbi:hypothetical protein NCER_102334, partial [Vairimorpha ceranae BRL01]